MIPIPPHTAEGTTESDAKNIIEKATQSGRKNSMKKKTTIERAIQSGKENSMKEKVRLEGQSTSVQSKLSQPVGVIASKFKSDQPVGVLPVLI